ncbi:MAG: PPC domain-containing protein, partial [Elainella sp.]
MARNRSDDTRDGARKLGVLTSQRTIQGRLGVINSSTFDLDDYFSFTLQSRSSFTAALRGLQGNLDLRLRSPDGTLIASSTRRGTRNERIGRTLEAGRYIIQVSTDGDTSPYRLILAPSDSLDGGGGGNNGGGGGDGGGDGGGGGDFPNPIAPGTDPGSFPATAFNVGALTGRRAYRGTVNLADDLADFYQIGITRSSRLRVLTNNVSGGTVSTDLIFDANGSGSVDSGDVLVSGADVTKALGAGTYFVGITAQTGTADVSYVLQLDESAITNLTTNSDPPLGLGGASDITPNAAPGSAPSDLNQLRNVTIRQVVSPSDTNSPQLVGSFDSTDIYQFRLSAEASNITALLNSAQTSGNVTMSLVFEDGDSRYGGTYFDDRNGIANPGAEDNGVIGGDFVAGITTGSSVGGSALAINKTLGAGRYYLIVTQNDLTDGTSYSLNLSANNVVTGLNPAQDINSIDP